MTASGIELTEMMFQDFNKFSTELQTLLNGQKAQETNQDALRCFLLGMLTNIFRSPVASKSGLTVGYVASTSEFVYLLTSRDVIVESPAGMKTGGVYIC